MLTVAVEKQLGEFALTAAFESAGGATALFGPSGAGKTSIINMIAGLLRPDRGRIVLDGDVLFDDAARIDVPAWRRRIGCVFQEGRLFPHLSVRHNLDYGRWVGGHAADRAGVRPCGGLARHRQLARAAAGQIVGRRAPARGGRPRAVDAPAIAAARRAARLARRRAQERDFAVSGTAARRGAGADDLCQPRRRRGTAHRQPGGAAGGRPGDGGGWGGAAGQNRHAAPGIHACAASRDGCRHARCSRPRASSA